MEEKIEFYKEKEFKDTEIGSIPKDWEDISAADIADYINGYPFSPTDWKMYGIPIIRIQNLNDPNAEFNFFNGEIDDIYKIKNGDLLFSWSASIGIYIWKRGDAVLNQHIFKVIPKTSINKLFLYYDLLLAIEQLKGRVHGSTMKHFQKNELKTIFIPIPSIKEQQKISEILSTIDETIQKTDDIIAKTESLKKGLMQELFTKGIGHKEFKDTEIGRIPKDWEVIKLRDVLLLLRNGITLRQRKERNGYPVTRIETISEEKIDPSKLGYVIGLSEEDIEEHRLIEGDILFSHINSIEHIGKTAIYEGVPDFLLHGMNLLLLRPDKNKVHPKFLLYLLRLLRARKTFWIMSKKAVNQASINQTELGNLRIFFPSLEEQQKIAEILSTIDEKLENLRREKTKLERIKQWFMEELLTGRIRVRIA